MARGMTAAKGIIRVPIKVWLEGPTYIALLAVAERRNLSSVGELLEQLSTASIAAGGEQPKRSWVRMTPERLNEMVRLHQGGMPYRQVAQELGASPSSVQGHLRRLGLTPPRVPRA